MTLYFTATPLLVHRPSCRFTSDTRWMSTINRLTPNDLYMSRTAPLTSKRCILYIYSTNACTEYFKHALYSPFFFSSNCSLFHNANLFGSYISHILYTGCAEIKKNNSGAKGLILILMYFGFSCLTLNSLTWKIWWAPNNASRWQMGFNSAFKGLILHILSALVGVLIKWLYEMHGATIKIVNYAVDISCP